MRAFVLAAGLWMLALPLWADARSTVLVDVLRLGELAEILQREGLENAETLDRDMPVSYTHLTLPTSDLV